MSIIPLSGVKTIAQPAHLNIPQQTDKSQKVDDRIDPPIPGRNEIVFEVREAQPYVDRDGNKRTASALRYFVKLSVDEGHLNDNMNLQGRDLFRSYVVNERELDTFMSDFGHSHSCGIENRNMILTRIAPDGTASEYQLPPVLERPERNSTTVSDDTSSRRSGTKSDSRGDGTTDSTASPYKAQSTSTRPPVLEQSVTDPAIDTPFSDGGGIVLSDIDSYSDLSSSSFKTSNGLSSTSSRSSDPRYSIEIDNSDYQAFLESNRKIRQAWENGNKGTTPGERGGSNEDQ